MVASNAGADALANAAPRASASSASSGALTGMDTRCSRCAFTEAMSTPDPTTNMACGADCCAVTAPASSVRTAIASALCRLRLSTLTTEPSSVCTTDSVAVSRSTNSSAVFSYPTARPTACASEAAAWPSETSMTSSMPCRASASRSAVAAVWSLHVTPIERR